MVDISSLGIIPLFGMVIFESGNKSESDTEILNKTESSSASISPGVMEIIKSSISSIMESGVTLDSK